MSHMDVPFKNIIAVKPKSSYPKKILEEFGLLSININKSMPIGTYSYRYARFPGDIDLYEQVDECCSIDDVVNLFTTTIKRIVLNIINKPLHYFMEVKAGIDDRYKLNIGELKNGKFTLNPNFFGKIFNLYQNKLLSLDEFNIIKEIIENNPRPTQLEYESIDELLRKHYVIRWTADEILHGIKILPNNKPITLEDAVKQKSQINIEIIAFLENRFIDESNFYVLSVKKPNGELLSINLPQEYFTQFPDFFIEGLKKSVEKLYYSKLNANPFKMLKRFWSLAKFLKDENMINKIYPFLSSDVASINQIKSDFGTLSKLLKKAKNIPMELVINELSNMKNRVANIILFDNDFIENFNESIDNLIIRLKSYPQISEILNDFGEFEDLFFDIVEKHTVKFLDDANLIPPPRDYLPKEMTYG